MKNIYKDVENIEMVYGNGNVEKTVLKVSLFGMEEIL